MWVPVASRRPWILLGTKTPLWVIRELQVALVGVQHLPRQLKPHIAGERIRIRRLRVLLKHAGPFGGELRALPSQLRPYSRPALTVA
jgi:hypothetical protein